MLVKGGNELHRLLFVEIHEGQSPGRIFRGSGSCGEEVSSRGPFRSVLCLKTWEIDGEAIDRVLVEIRFQ